MTETWWVVFGGLTGVVGGLIVLSLCLWLPVHLANRRDEDEEDD